ncbi:unnamed protein product [Absidia cylindrospora]
MKRVPEKRVDGSDDNDDDQNETDQLFMIPDDECLSKQLHEIRQRKQQRPQQQHHEQQQQYHEQQQQHHEQQHQHHEHQNQHQMETRAGRKRYQSSQEYQKTKNRC